MGVRYYAVGRSWEAIYPMRRGDETRRTGSLAAQRKMGAKKEATGHCGLIYR